MSTIDSISLTVQTRQEILAKPKNETGNAPGDFSKSILRTPGLGSDPSFSQGALQLGVAENGSPILLDLFDPLPGPLLVAADCGCGKTAFLQSIALGSDVQDPGEILFSVLTPFPEEWAELEVFSNCLGIWPAYHSMARHFLKQLVSWTDVLPATRQVVVVFVDGIDLLIANGFQDQSNLRWLLTYGPRRHVWPVVSVNPGRLLHPESWLPYFQTRILGQVKRPETVHILAPGRDVDAAHLTSEGKYGIWRQDCWVKFKLPAKNEI